MRKKDIRMIITDLDGTLLDSAGHVPEENVRASREAIRAGIIVTVATGRMYASAKKIADALGVTVPLVCYNGAMIRRPDGTTPLHQCLDLDVARDCLAIFRERGTYVQSYIDDVLNVRDTSADEAEFYERHYGISGHAAGDALYEPTSAPTKLLAMTSGLDETHEVIDLLSRRHPKSLYVTSSDANFVEVMHIEVNKARSVAMLAAELGVPMDAVMAIGDGENDAEMIAASGLGVAMANARQMARDVAKATAPSNDENGFAWAVRELVMR